ncbi:MAG: LysR family transcriptional regulator [Caulobacteraceae bacterium]
MEVFTKAVELGSFSAAAEALRMSPQLVGKQVGQLEQHLGVQLLKRTTRRQSLTEVGRRFYDRAKLILAEMEAAEGLAAETHAMPRGTLRVNAPVSFGSYALAKALPDYVRENPNVSVDLTLSNRVVDLVDEGYDVVFRVGELADSGLIARALAPYRLILCAAPAYLAKAAPLSVPSDLQAHGCLGFAHAKLGTQWDFDGPNGRVSVAVSGPLMADHSDPLLWAALAGLGVALLPSEVVETALKAGGLVEVLPDFRAPNHPMHLLHGADRRLTPKLRSFIDFAASRFAPGRS